MKKLLILTACLLVITALSAQPLFDLGVKAGFTSSTLEPIREWSNSSNRLSYHAGVFSRLGWGRFFIQPEAYYNSRGGKLEFEGNPANAYKNIDFSTLDVPVLAGVKLVKVGIFNFRVMGGPVLGFITSGKIESRPEPTADYFKNHFYGWQYGAGVDLWFLTLDARIENTRNSIYQSSDFSTRNKVFMITAGFKIF